MAVKPFDVAAFSKASFIDPKEVGYQDSIDIIREELQKTRKSFIKIGWYLKHINESSMYTEDGYSNIYEFARDKFNISQSTATRFINLCIDFSVNHDSPELDEQYMEFSVSQLFEMLPMKQEEKEQITSDMTVKEIREVNKKIKANKEPKDAEIKLFYNNYLKNLSIDERKLLKEHLILHYGKCHAEGGGGQLDYRCTPRGISLNRSDEITWTRFVDRVNKLLPIQEENQPEADKVEAEASGKMKEDDNIPGQTSIEKDFPEYMPDDTADDMDSQSEQEKETVIDGEYRVVDEAYKEAKKSSDTSEEDLRDEIGKLIDGIKSVFWKWEGQAIPLEELEMSKKNSLELTIAIEKLMNILK